MERVWGGRRLETVLGKNIPPGSPVGESWEIVDREDAQSVVHNGQFAGSTLHELWVNQREEIFGPMYRDHASARFPLLFKVLDARERLSVQVHPPTSVAAALGGEPKTEMWAFLESTADASIYAGLKRSVTRGEFDLALRTGEVAKLLHKVPVSSGDSIFIPSGRLHAIAEGCLLVEVQQNSDTTYRVYDWNRQGMNGKPRTLHIDESLASIDFNDFEPALNSRDEDVLAACEHFVVERISLDAGVDVAAAMNGMFAIYSVMSGDVLCGGDGFARGAFFLAPASGANLMLRAVGGPAQVLRTILPNG